MLVDNIVPPQELIGFVRELAFADLAVLDAYLPNQDIASIEYAFERSDRVRHQAAQYRPFDVESPIGRRPGFARVRGEIPPISKKMVLGEEERLRLDMLNRSGTVSAEIVQQTFDDAAMLTESVRARVAYAKAQVLTTGKVTFVNDLGFEAGEIDYGIPVGHFVAPLVDWSDHTNATPITDMRGWFANPYRPANAGRNPGIALVSSTTALDLQLSAEVRSFLVIGGAVGATLPILTPEQVNQILGANGLPRFVIVDTEVDLPGAGVTRLIGESTVVFLPGSITTARFGGTFYGVTAEALRLAQSGLIRVNTAPGLVGVQYDTEDPVHTWTKVAGVVVPVLKDPKAVMVADVAGGS